MAPSLGLSFDRQYPAAFVAEMAEALEARGIDQLWVIEDCFYTAGISLAATALARSRRLQVGLGILPVAARNPAVTAMELATLAELAPGRLLAGLGHGVQEWMEQMGARTPSPLTTIEEALTIVRRLLAGQNVTYDGRQFTMRDVELEHPPTTPPPVLAGVRGPKSLEVAGRCADGLVLAEGAGPAYTRWSLEQAGRSADDLHVTVFSALRIEEDGHAARTAMAPFVAGLLTSPNPALDAHPHIDEMRERHAGGGVPALADMPTDWWAELGAIGTFDDAVAHVTGLHEAGAHDISFFVGPEVEIARREIDQIAGLRQAVAG
jgi:alkanesulfonate monooxygenase SsuD/methylene tetrahydromethanopterin reductase-like flavin-dependent oxidoreductase (luciferase family)